MIIKQVIQNKKTNKEISPCQFQVHHKYTNISPSIGRLQQNPLQMSWSPPFLCQIFFYKLLN